MLGNAKSCGTGEGTTHCGAQVDRFMPFKIRLVTPHSEELTFMRNNALTGGQTSASAKVVYTQTKFGWRNGYQLPVFMDERLNRTSSTYSCDTKLLHKFGLSPATPPMTLKISSAMVPSEGLHSIEPGPPRAMPLWNRCLCELRKMCGLIRWICIADTA